MCQQAYLRKAQSWESSDLSQAKRVFPLHTIGKQHTITTSAWLKLKAVNLFKMNEVHSEQTS